MNALINPHYSALTLPKKGEDATIQPLSLMPEETLKLNGQQPSFLQGVLEAMMDGVLVITDTGKLIYANRYARQVCLQWIQKADCFTHSSENRFASLKNRHRLIPKPIWQTCKTLIENQNLVPRQLHVLEDEISIDPSKLIRIRARWIELDPSHRACLLVTLEDRSRSSQDMAIAEAQKYGLTERETEVWQLRRANFTYKAIALQLHIAVDTVKKHLKSIHAKRQAFLWQEE